MRDAIMNFPYQIVLVVFNLWYSAIADFNFTASLSPWGIILHSYNMLKVLLKETIWFLLEVDN